MCLNLKLGELSCRLDTHCTLGKQFYGEWNRLVVIILL